MDQLLEEELNVLRNEEMCEDFGSDYMSTDEGEEDAVEENVTESDEEYIESEEDRESTSGDTDAEIVFSKNKLERWNTNPPVQTGRTGAQKVLKEKSGATRFANRAIDTIESSFLLYFRNPLLAIVTKWSNQEGIRIFRKNWTPLDNNELIRFIGVLILIGVYKSKNEEISQLWSLKNGRNIFNRVMSRNRFQNILRILRFDDASKRRQQRSDNKLQPIRECFELWNTYLQDAYSPGWSVTIDEQLVTFRGRCPFRQYIPSKPGRCGIKIWALCDSKTFYAWNLIVYTGKEGNVREVNQGENVVYLPFFRKIFAIKKTIFGGHNT